MNLVYIISYLVLANLGWQWYHCLTYVTYRRHDEGIVYCVAAV